MTKTNRTIRNLLASLHALDREIDWDNLPAKDIRVLQIATHIINRILDAKNKPIIACQFGIKRKGCKGNIGSWCNYCRAENLEKNERYCQPLYKLQR